MSRTKETWFEVPEDKDALPVIVCEEEIENYPQPKYSLRYSDIGHLEYLELDEWKRVPNELALAIGLDPILTVRQVSYFEVAKLA